MTTISSKLAVLGLALVLCVGHSVNAADNTDAMKDYVRHQQLQIELSTSTSDIDSDSNGRRFLQFDWDWDFGDVPDEFCWLPLTNCEAADECEEVSPLPADQFDLERYIAQSWFIQKQQVNPYQSENDLYCVVATYNTRDDGFLQVLNTANTGGVDGEPQNPETNSFFGRLCAEQVDGGSLRVAPCFLQYGFPLVAGPYWVLALGDDYSWAIVSGGPPNQVRETINGRTFCTTKEGSSFLDTNGSGLWLFTRQRVASAKKISMMEAKLTEMGIYTGDLKPVVQGEGCTYLDTLKEAKQNQ